MSLRRQVERGASRGSLEELRLRCFRLDVTLRSDVSEVVAYCHDLFAHFETDGPPVDASTLEIVSRGPRRWRVRDPWIDAVVDERSWLEGIAVARILEIAGNEVDDHDLFHGAALSHCGRGLVVLGESGFGKSTLTLALLARGWKFLSEEIAVLARDRARVVAFPKAIEAGADAIRLAGLEPSGSPARRGKHRIDPGSIGRGTLSPPCDVAAIVVLGDPRAKDSAAGAHLRLCVHRRGRGALEALREVDGVLDAAWAGERGGRPEILVRFVPGEFPAWRLDEILGRHGIMILDSSAEEPPPLDFAREPRLRTMATHEGVGELLRRFRGRRAFARRVREAGDFASLFVSMAERFRDVAFHRLDVGRLDRSVEILEGLVR